MGTGTKAKGSLGLWLEQGELNYTDAMIAPCTSNAWHLKWEEYSRRAFTGLLRSEKVLKPYRNFVQPDNTKYRAWLGRVLDHPAVRATTSTDDLYLDSYQRYADNNAGTKVSDAVNAGKGLP